MGCVFKMRIYDKYLKIPQEGAISDHVMLGRLLYSVLVALLCLIAIIYTAYSVHQFNVLQDLGRGKIALAQIGVSVYDVNGEEITLNYSAGNNHRVLLDPGTYTVTFHRELVNDSAFCRIAFSHTDQRYHTVQLGKDRLAQGARIVEVLKQDRNTPVPVELQVCIIYAVVNNYLKDVPVEMVKEYEKELYFEMSSYHQDVLELILNPKGLNDESRAALDAAIDYFTKKFLSIH